MNFSSMEYFTVLAQERNFTRAAERLHITQQSLSSHIAGMEKELGSQLLVRRVPLELTYAGEVMLKYAAGFQKFHNDMQREFCDISQKQKGILRVGAASTRGQMILPETIALFQESYPNISIELMEGSNGELHQKLLKGTIDLAIAEFPDNLPDISLTDFYREENVLVIEKGLFSKCFTFSAEECERRLLAGDYSVLRECPFVLGGIDDIDGRIGRDVLKRAGIDGPFVTATSHNVGQHSRSRSVRLPADNSTKHVDTAAGRLPMGIPTWRGICTPYPVWVSGTVLSMERHREIHFMCQGHFLLITNFFRV